VDSLESFWNAVQAFVDALGSVALGPLLLAVVFHLLNLALRTRAWRNILGAAYPAENVAWKPVFGAYCAGVGVNAVVPARGGDVVKLLLAHRSIRGSSYPALTSSLLAETIFDFFMGSLILIWAIGFGVAPFPDLPSLPLFEFSWMARHPMVTGVGVILILAGTLAALILAQHRIRAFWARVEQGLTILKTPHRYWREVVTYQAAGWLTRVFTAFFFLQAFHVPATLRNALLIMVVGAVATIMPFTPGGAGPKQALLVVLLAGEAARSDVLALSVGMEITVAAANIATGALCMAFIFRDMGIKGAIAHARESTSRSGRRRRKTGAGSTEADES
jgi:uncharacterized membrane protein YbhN (UPF0104 family)